ncbi:MAG TPA: DUF4435 domain-containing protein [Rhodocyclaceae bacterium]|nr:DUF4435 domain-containing protein [Rhodocyclaceae bacterium]
MSATAFPGCFLLVEGSSDSRFFRPRVSSSDCEIVICGAKPLVIDATKSANRGVAKTLGVVDDDFDRALGVSHETSDLVSTDTHDIETLLLSSRALEKVVNEFVVTTTLTDFCTSNACDIRTALLRRATPFGQYRLINAIHQLNVPFAASFSPWKYLDPTSWTLDVGRLQADFAASARLNAADVGELVQRLPAIPPWNLVQGHDAISILAIAFRGVLRAKPCPSEDELSASLRLAFEDIYFQSTDLCLGIKQWEARKAAQVLGYSVS